MESTSTQTRITFCSLAELRERKRVTRWIEEFRDEVTALEWRGEILVFSSVCLHMGGEFDVDWEKGCLRCRWHAWEFDPGSGECRTFSLPSRQLRHYPFSIEGGELIVRLGDDEHR